MLSHWRRVRLGSLALRTLEGSSAAAANAQAQRAYTPNAISAIGELHASEGCSTSGCSDCGCSHGGNPLGLQWRSLLHRSATWGAGKGLEADRLASSAHGPVGALQRALTQMRDAVQTGVAAVALQVGLGRWAGGSENGGGGGGGLLLARRLPTEPEPFEDEYDDDEYEDGEYVDFDDEDLMGDLGEVQEDEDEWWKHIPDEEEEDGVGEEEDDDDVAAPPRPPASSGGR
ncbi:hypothetical protein PLESTB_001330100 [Pleodorina starrii]|uniref:Uncharacterized protein n=1 Tax=Pleodorina starrii TaxID=330485 RepID=A0A9W6BUB8_9CHLO|nr:hypothetical protein PLESTM_001626100 [Pleodorina starrii]GLC58203.1 hypothetical protein PLESTB_001330100 [Pleodorina starrii]GLC75529.1 hypothetical protein PLESTF_001653700 [Pleodorina starrii]